jgi:acyl-CoA thioesterase-2
VIARLNKKRKERAERFVTESKLPEITHEKSLEAQAILLEKLDLEEIDQDLYRGYNEPNGMGRIFGGQVVAQSLMAAGRTLDGLLAHSLHGYFLRPGDPEIPVIYTVDRIRDGRSFVTRRVVAKQGGKAIFNMSCSFHKFEEGLEHQIEMPDAPDPETLPTWADRIIPLWKKAPERLRKAWRPGARPVDMRESEAPVYLGGKTKRKNNMTWLRTPGPMPDDPFLHQCVLAYATDFSLIETMLGQHKLSGRMGGLITASLDHAVWFHAPVRVDDWLLYIQDSPVAGGARGYARGSIFTRDGRYVASAVQEGLMRVLPPADPEDAPR